MVADIKSYLLTILFLLYLGLYPFSLALAEHDQGQGKSQHPDSGVSIAPEPSSMLLFAAGGALIISRCRKKK